MMLAAKNNEFDLIAVWKIDRMSRNLSHLLNIFEELREHKVSFFSLKENIDFSWPVWRLTFQIFWALAEFEREMIKSRTSEGKRASARRWNYIWNGIPYWYDRDKKEWEKWTKLKIVKEEAKVLRMIFNWFVFEKYHYVLIARKLWEMWVAKGVASRQSYKNTEWNQATIRRMLENTTYIWTRIERLKDDDWEIEEIEVKVPAILDEDIFDFAQVRIEEVENEDKWKKNWWWNNSYLLSRKIVDIDTKKCLVWYKRNENTYWYRRKKMEDKNTGIIYSNVDIPWEAIDTFIWKQIETAVKRPEMMFKMFRKQIDSWDDLDRLKDEAKLLVDDIKKKDQIIENIELDYYKWILKEEKKTTFINKTNKEIVEAKKTLNIIDAKIDNLIKVLYSEEMIKRVSEKYKNNFDRITIEQQQAVVDALVDKIYVKKEDDWNLRIQVMFKFDPEKIENKQLKDELKNSTSTWKSNDAINVSNVNGRERETRTRNRTVPNRVR